MFTLIGLVCTVVFIAILIAPGVMLGNYLTGKVKDKSSEKGE